VPFLKFKIKMRKHLFFLMVLITQWCMAHDGGNFMASDLLKSMKPGDKAAILMVHFGSTYDDTRALTIDPLNQKARETFKDLEVREAFTSRIVIRRLKEKGIEKQNPLGALQQLKADGFTHVIVQSSNIIEGVEMESLRRDVASIQGGFKDIRIGNPLLYAPEDYEAAIKALIPARVSGKAIVLVGHGTYTPATAQYAMLDYMLKAKGYNNYHVTTVEGYPTFEDMEAKLKQDGVKQVILQPFMFVAGDHARNDIAGDMKDELEEKGYQVEVLMEGLGQNPAIQQIFLDHIRFSLHHKMLDIMDKKKHYETSDDDHHDHHH